MRLLKRSPTGELQLFSFDGDDAPQYAILSHTWIKDEEVTYEDLVDRKFWGKIGFDKIRFCLDRATKDGLEYCWVDTCCINKANFTELTEAINSMFKWYQKARRCYVYLSDVLYSDPSWEAAFRASRWFKRGWTLQELIAPTIVEFFSADRQFLGSRDPGSLQYLIHEITGLPVKALKGDLGFLECSFPERLIWSARRDTTRPEDKAYCLLGIFDTNMYLIYGEGERAYVRLWKTIMENSSSAILQLIEALKSQVNDRVKATKSITQDKQPINTGTSRNSASIPKGGEETIWLRVLKPGQTLRTPNGAWQPITKENLRRTQTDIGQKQDIMSRIRAQEELINNTLETVEAFHRSLKGFLRSSSDNKSNSPRQSLGTLADQEEFQTLLVPESILRDLLHDKEQFNAAQREFASLELQQSILQEENESLLQFKKMLENEVEELRKKEEQLGVALKEFESLEKNYLRLRKQNEIQEQLNKELETKVAELHKKEEQLGVALMDFQLLEKKYSILRKETEKQEKLKKELEDKIAEVRKTHLAQLLAVILLLFIILVSCKWWYKDCRNTSYSLYLGKSN